MTRVVRISIDGLKSDGSISIVDELSKMEGVIRSSSDIEDSSIEVEYNSSIVGFKAIKESIEKTGHYII